MESITFSTETLRDLFAVLAPEPNESSIKSHLERDRMRDPHNDNPNFPRRGEQEIRCDLRYEFADAMLKARKAKKPDDSFN